MKNLDFIFERTLEIQREKQLVFIVIDGCGGVGKTTLAKKIRQKLQNVSVVHMDNFDRPYALRLKLPPQKKPVGADTDWKRLVQQVIVPLKKGKPATFQKYNWDEDIVDSTEEIKPEGIVIIEGVYATRNELRDYYDLKIWVDCPLDIRLKRGIGRDGEEHKDRWLNDWLPMEERYMDLHKPQEKTDFLYQT